MSTELVMYCRTYHCPFQRQAERFLKSHNVQPRMIYIDRDREAAKKVVGWTGFEVVPTFVFSEEGSSDPITPPTPLAPGQSPRDRDRGSIVSEPSDRTLEAMLKRHGIL